MNKVDNYFSNSFSTVNKNAYVSIIIYIILLCYVGFIVYKLPHHTAPFFTNMFVKVALLSLSAYVTIRCTYWYPSFIGCVGNYTCVMEKDA